MAGLTNDRAEAQKKIETYQALLDIAASMKELAANPDFAQLSQDAYALPAADQAKADAGRETIAQIDAKLAQQAQNAKDLQDEQDNIDLRTQQLADASNAVTADRKKVTDREDAVSAREDAVTARESAVSDREAKVTDRENKVASDQNALKAAQADFAQQQADAKARADEIKRLTAGM